MQVFAIAFIAGYFPLFGASMLRLLKARRSDLWTATALGFVVTLLAGAVFYDFAKFKYFVPSMVWLLAAIMLLTHWRGGIDKPFVTVSRKQLLLLAIFLLVALLGRVPVSNFIFEIGDAGSYVNSANHLAWSGGKSTQFFPLNQVLLGIFAYVGGPGLTPYGTTFASLASVFLAFLVGRAYFGGRRAGWILAGIVSLNALAMWFGRLPYSESLMLACNLGALAYWKVATTCRPRRTLHFVLFGLFVAAASLTRVTGILWMLILSGSLVYLCLRNSRLLRPFLLSFAIAAIGYGLSVQVALDLGINYYIGWQLSKYLPWLTTPAKIVMFHFEWIVLLSIISALALWAARRWNPLKWLLGHGALVTTVLFVGALLAVTALKADGWRDWTPINVFTQGRESQEYYYLNSFFTLAAIPVFIVGWIAAIRKHNPIRDESWVVFWLFAFVFLALSHVGPTIRLSHGVYMYGDRYFLSDSFIAYVLILTAGTLWLLRWKMTSWLAVLFAAAYSVQAVAWIGMNFGKTYLKGGYEMVDWLQKNIPRQGSVVYLDNQYDHRWLFPNLRRSLLLPLNYSFGYDTRGTGYSNSPFSPDAPLSYFASDKSLAVSSVEQSLESGKDVYVVLASKAGVAGFATALAQHVDVIARRGFVVQTRSSNRGQVFAGGYSEYPIVLEIGHVRDNSVNLASARNSGVYRSDYWTNGDAFLDGLQRCGLGPKPRVKIETNRYLPHSISTDALKLEVFANDTRLEGSWLDRTHYVADIPSGIKCVESLRIKSTTFVPKKLRINNDQRELGIDLKRIVIQ